MVTNDRLWKKCGEVMVGNNHAKWKIQEQSTKLNGSSKRRISKTIKLIQN